MEAQVLAQILETTFLIALLTAVVVLAGSARIYTHLETVSWNG